MDDVCATARWANRMLRPLTSQYHRLGKYRELQSLNSSRRKLDDDSVEHKVRVGASTRKVHEGTGLSDSECGDTDPSWIPGKKDYRRIKHKYVVRGDKTRGRTRVRAFLRSPDVPRTLPGAIEIATPLITGKSIDIPEQRSEGVNSVYRPQVAREGTLSRDRKASGKMLSLLKQSRFSQHDDLWKASLNSSRDVNYVDIVYNLDRLLLKFLEKTRVSDSRNPRPAGRARSLLLSVMRCLPEFIAEEQKLHDEGDDEEDVNIADAYFTELEAAYGSHTRGWLPLREAVRAQGLFLVSDMIQKSWVTPFTALSLVEKCVHAGEYDAVQTLLSSQLLAIHHYDYPNAFDPWRLVELGRDPMKVLHNYWIASGHNSYMFDALSKLLLRGAIPPEWMVTTPWKSCMTSATGSVSTNDQDSAAATRLIEAVILSAGGIYPNSHRDGPSALTEGLDTQVSRVRCPVYIQDALSNLVSSLITALCGMQLARADDISVDEGQSHTRIRNLVSGMALVVQREIELRHPGRKDGIPTFHLLRRGYVLLGNYLLRCACPLPPSDMDNSDVMTTDNLASFLWQLYDKPEIIKELSTMVGQVVRCCERRDERQQCLRAQQYCRRFLRFEGNGIENISLFLGKIAVEVAMDFAQSSQDPEDHAWATDIQERFADINHRTNRRSGKANSKSIDQQAPPFRWEESIGEWVSATPMTRTGSNVPPKPLVMIFRRPSSPSSISEVSSSISRDHASSVTSSVPSSTLKRTERDNDIPNQIDKRARTMYSTRSQRTRQVAERQSCSVSSSDEEQGPAILAAESVITDELSVLRKTTRSRSRRDLSPAGKPSSSKTVQKSGLHNNADIAVIIYNHMAPNFAPAPMVTRGRGRPRRQAPVKLPRATPALRLPLPRRRFPVIPCSENEDSEDELSFL